MTASELRELDAWIAVNVMGWRVHCRNTAIYVPKEREHSILDPWSHDYRDVAMWRPTVDKSAAMDVLERCAEKISCAPVQIYKGADESPEFRPLWCVTHDQIKEVYMGDSLPLAICLFAKALFGKEGV